jgi:hypothetical protein
MSLFARPHELDRRAHRLRDLHRLQHVVDVDAPAEASAEERRADRDLLRLHARGGGREADRQLRELARAVQQHRIGFTWAV